MNMEKTMFAKSGVNSKNKDDLLRKFMFIVPRYLRIDSVKEYKIQFIPLFLIIFFISFSRAFGQSGDPVSVDPIHWNKALKQDGNWYRSSEAIRIADNVLLYQHPTGGWPKNINMAQALREAFLHEMYNPFQPNVVRFPDLLGRKKVFKLRLV